MAFRKKNKTREVVVPKLTLDSLHKNMTNSFLEKKDNLPDLNAEREHILAEIANIKTMPGYKAIIPDLKLQTRLWTLEEKLALLDKEILNINSQVHEKNYLIKTGKILNQYYKLLNKEKAITEQSSKLDFHNKQNNSLPATTNSDNTISNSSSRKSNNLTPNPTQAVNNSNTNIVDLLNCTLCTEMPTQYNGNVDGSVCIGSPSQDATQLDSSNNNLLENNENNNKHLTNSWHNPATAKPAKINTRKQKKKDIMDWLSIGSESSDNELDKQKLYDQYMKIIDPTYVPQIEDELELFDICGQCHSEMQLNHNSGMLNCKNCGLIEKIIVDSDKQSHKEPPKEMTSFSYKRVNHLNEILSQFQAKETTEIPAHVYENIEIELKKARITDMTLLTKEKLREILKKIDETDYYEHIPYIINQLNGLPPPVISAEVEEIIRGLFLQAQPPFNTYCPDDRKNFLTYGYTLYKLFELLELDEYLSNFKFLKDRKKLYDQEQIWKKICNELKWEFIPSI